MAFPASKYDPFAPGGYSTGERTFQARDAARDRVFPCDIWYPDSAQPGAYPLIVFSHSSGGRRRQSTFLCTHLASHGYVVAAMDHSETIAPELAAKPGETAEEKAARADGWIANRVPDIRFLLDYLLGGGAPDIGVDFDSSRIGMVGHSFGGWTALAAQDFETRVGAVVALAPGGSSKRKPGILPLTLSFRWRHDVPTLYLVAGDDITLPLEGMYELFERTPASVKRMVILRRADHLHFMDDVEKQHEAVRAMQFPAELAWIQKEMRPIAELCSGEKAQLFTCALTLAHLDSVLRGEEAAHRFLEGDLETELAARGVDAFVPRPRG